MPTYLDLYVAHRLNFILEIQKDDSTQKSRMKDVKSIPPIPNLSYLICLILFRPDNCISTLRSDCNSSPHFISRWFTSGSVVGSSKFVKCRKIYCSVFHLFFSFSSWQNSPSRLQAPSPPVRSLNGFQLDFFLRALCNPLSNAFAMSVNNILMMELITAHYTNINYRRRRFISSRKLAEYILHDGRIRSV